MVPCMAPSWHLPVGQLPPNQDHQREADQQEEHAGEGVLKADDLVVGGEDVLAEQLLEEIEEGTRPKAKGKREMLYISGRSSEQFALVTWR